jgi:aminoglycoside phosphotransferase (APT) family kinase protein
LRHKPSRRCVIEYDVRIKRPGEVPKKSLLIGKIRARRFGNEGYRLQDAIWNAGFDHGTVDGLAVPEPIAVIPSFRMWLQRRVTGVVSSEPLAGADGIALSRRIAEAIHKLHRANVPTDRTHTMGDELRILHEHLPLVANSRPGLAQRIGQVLEDCGRLGARVPEPARCGIHRDFHPAQVIVKGRRLFLIDFDLYCLGDPALDIGNFIGHMTEESLRAFGDARALADREAALADRFVGLSGENVRPSVHAYTTLTLARHVYLSTQFAERRPLTDRLLELVESRLAG